MQNQSKAIKHQTTHCKTNKIQPKTKKQSQDRKNKQSQTFSKNRSQEQKHQQTQGCSAKTKAKNSKKPKT